MQTAQTALQYAAPVIVLFYYVFTVTFSLCTLQSRRNNKRDRLLQITNCCVRLISINYLAQLGYLVIDSLSPTPSISTLAANVSPIHARASYVPY